MNFMTQSIDTQKSNWVNIYQEEGYLVIPNLLSEEDLIEVKRSLAEKVSEIADELAKNELIQNKCENHPFETRLAEVFKNLTDKDFLKYGRSWRDRKAGYFNLMSNPAILDVVEMLIGPEIFSSPIYNVRPKVPRVAAGAVPWHQDKSYWPDANANPVITVWIPLVDSTLENGCLHICPRTHKKRMLNHYIENHTGGGYTEIRSAEVEQCIQKSKVIPIPLKAGGAVIFNDRCLHMSTPNRSNSIRWSVDLRYQPTDQDPMKNHGIGFLARSRKDPGRVATLEDWLANRPEKEM